MRTPVRLVAAIVALALWLFADGASEPASATTIPNATEPAAATTAAAPTRTTSLPATDPLDFALDISELLARPELDGSQVVFLTASDGETRATVAMGRGADLPEALVAAGEQLRLLWRSPGPARWVKVDVVTSVETLANIDVAQPLPLNERGLDGLALDWAAGLAFLPAEVVANTLIDSDLELRFDNVNEYARHRLVVADRIDQLESAGTVDLQLFTTDSVFIANPPETVPLFRGHRMFDSVDASLLLDSAAAGGRYLTAAVGPDGRFVYRYLPKSDSIPNDYNIVRHAGTVYSMAELYGVTGGEELLSATRRAVDYLIETASARCPAPLSEAPARCVVEAGDVKLGANALSVLAMAKYVDVTGDDRYLAVVQELAEWIAGAQRPDGSFVHEVGSGDGEIHNAYVRFYPGEAIFALARLYQLDGEERWLDVAEAATRYQIEVRDGGLATEDLPSDHWLLYGISELHPLRPDPLFLRHAMRITHRITARQQTDPPVADWLGSYESLSSTATATRSEGLCAAYGLAAANGLAEDATRILDAVELGLRYQLQTQFRPEGVLYLADPQRALGGFHRHLTNFEIRNDYVQHNVSSLLCAAKVLAGED